MRTTYAKGATDVRDRLCDCADSSFATCPIMGAVGKHFAERRGYGFIRATVPELVQAVNEPTKSTGPGAKNAVSALTQRLLERVSS